MKNIFSHLLCGTCIAGDVWEGSEGNEVGSFCIIQTVHSVKYILASNTKVWTTEFGNYLLVFRKQNDEPG